MKSKEDSFQYIIFTWGIYPFSLAIKEYQDNEKYELCADMFKALREHCNTHNITIPDVNNFCVGDYIQCFWEKGYAGNIAENNLPFYVDEVKKEIEKL